MSFQNQLNWFFVAINIKMSMMYTRLFPGEGGGHGIVADNHIIRFNL